MSKPEKRIGSGYGIDSVPFLWPIEGRWPGDHGHEDAVVELLRLSKWLAV